MTTSTSVLKFEAFAAEPCRIAATVPNGHQVAIGSVIGRSRTEAGAARKARRYCSCGCIQVREALSKAAAKAQSEIDLRHDRLKEKFPEQYALGVSQAELFWDAFGSVHTTDHAIIACESIPGMPLGPSDKAVAQRLGFKRTLRAKQVACKCQNCRNTLPL